MFCILLIYLYLIGDIMSNINIKFIVFGMDNDVVVKIIKVLD